MKPIKWTSEMDALLGKMSDTDTAKRFNISRTSVYNRRNQLGIPRLPQQNSSPPPPMGGWNKHKWDTRYLALLGTMPDHKLATLMGVDKSTVGRKRRSLSIPSYETQNRLLTWSPEMDQLLGTSPDPVIAERLDISAPSVAHRRYELSIPSYQSNHRLIPENVSCKDPQSQTFYTQRRNAMISNLPHNFTLKDWEFACSFFGHKCAYCQAEKPLTQDHLVAVSNGGGYTPENIIPACGSCNSTKFTHTWQEWVSSQFPNDEAKATITKIERYQLTVASPSSASTAGR